VTEYTGWDYYMLRKKVGIIENPGPMIDIYKPFTASQTDEGDVPWGCKNVSPPPLTEDEDIKQEKEFERWQSESDKALEKRVKDIEERIQEGLGKQYQILADRLKDLEQGLNDNRNHTHRDHTARIKDLEERDKTWMPLQNRIVDLEEWKQEHGLKHVNDNALGRLDKLEEWKQNHIGHNHKFLRHEERLQAFEEWKQGHQNNWHGKDESYHEERIKKLEEWKERAKKEYLGTISLHDIHELQEKVNTLEEWKQKVEGRHNEIVANYVENKKVIDKKIWEGIKRNAELLLGSGPDKSDIKRLKEAIKKAEEGAE
jgi:hypothetical protein